MIPLKPNLIRLSLLVLSVFVFSTFKIAAQGADASKGQALFSRLCASCHSLDKVVVGPPLRDAQSHWDDQAMLHKWVHNYQDAINAGYPRAVEIEKFSPTQMQKFGSSITDAEIDNIFAYIASAPKPGPPGGGGGGGGETPPDNQGAILFGIISLIMAIIALILMQVNSNLKKLSDDKEGIHRPEPVAFYKNKIYIALVSIILFVVGGYYLAKGAIGLGRQKNWEPKQPIYYSHKVHAGINQINCLYCHGGAMEGKQASIPSVNVCMNCHKQISEYSGPKLHDENGNEINGTNEIMKLYSYAGVDPKNPRAFDATKAKEIQWIRIHNLPDHVYFNHSQHVNAGKVQCQTCHGEIPAMDEVKQFSELSMSWCINCHRTTNVNFNYDSTKGNKFYSIYEKFHNDIKAGKMDSVKVENIGGLECQRCHY